MRARFPISAWGALNLSHSSLYADLKLWRELNVKPDYTPVLSRLRVIFRSVTDYETEPMNSSFAAFFRRKGAVELLCIADRRDFQGRFTDLDDEINVSHSTLSKRLSEAQELGLITVAINPEASSPENVYRTTQTGKEIQNEMRELGLPRTYEKLRTIEDLFAEGSEDLVEWAESLDAELVEKAEEFSKRAEDSDARVDPDIEFDPLNSQVVSAVLEDIEDIER